MRYFDDEGRPTLKIRRKFEPNVVGAWQCLPMDVYQAAPGVSKSQLDKLHASPLRYARWLADRKKHAPPTIAMQWGSLIHTAILEPQHLGAYTVRPDTYGEDGKPWNNNAKECRAWNEAHAGETVITAAQKAEMQLLARRVRTHPVAGPLLRGGRAEVSCFALVDKPYPILLKGRMDYVRVKGREVWQVVDLKTTRDASTAAFSREVWNRRYHVQAAMYRRILMRFGAPAVEFIFIALDKADPDCPLINVRRLEDSAI
ncbi:MAG: hypothetical protein D6781_12120, partial [Verrucomicrobia bacterium]